MGVIVKTSPDRDTIDLHPGLRYRILVGDDPHIYTATLLEPPDPNDRFRPTWWVHEDGTGGAHVRPHRGVKVVEIDLVDAGRICRAALDATFDYADDLYEQMRVVASSSIWNELCASVGLPADGTGPDTPG